MTTWYLGLSTSGHDPALAIVDENCKLAYAEATERFVQDKRAWGIAPDHVNHLEQAFKACGVAPETDHFVVSTSWKAAKTEIDINVHDAMLPGLDTLWMRGLQSGLQRSAGASLLRLGVPPERTKLIRHDHHLCHAVTAAWFAPTDSATCVVIDGEGDVGAVSAFTLQDRHLKRLWRSWGPGSLGTFYGWLTFHCGFDWRLGEEWKVMGLAAYGQVIPWLRDEMIRLLHVDRGRLRFIDDAEIAAITAKLRPFARGRAEPIMKAADLAATGQAAYSALADQVIRAALAAAHSADEAAQERRDLILSGGCALNSSYNGTLAQRLGVGAVHVPCCPADDGNAIGAALLGWMQQTGTDRIPQSSDGSPFLGAEIGNKLQPMRQFWNGFAVEDVSSRSAAAVAAALARGEVIGTLRGRAEFGPRALGNRSILADPRHPDMKDRINARVKGREIYRPFAPVVRDADMPDWFETPQASPYMSMTLPWRESRKAQVPAVVHADGTGRLQTVTRQTYPWMDALLGAFDQITGVPIVLNTSFNVMGKPIVNSIEDAFAVLCTTGLDAILIEDLLIRKQK